MPAERPVMKQYVLVWFYSKLFGVEISSNLTEGDEILQAEDKVTNRDLRCYNRSLHFSTFLLAELCNVNQ